MTPKSSHETPDNDGSLQGLLDSFVGLTTLRSPEEILQRAVDVARLSTQARYGAAVTVDEGEITAFVYEGLTKSEAEAVPEKPSDLGMLGAVLEQQATIRRDRLKEEESSVGFPLNDVAVGAFLGVPIKFGGELRGALYMTKLRGHGAFSEQDELFMTALAGQSAIALGTAHLISELEEQRAITELLERVAVASNEAIEPSEAFHTCLDAICSHTGWPIGHVYLLSESAPDVLEPTNIWHLADDVRFKAFTSATSSTKQRRGQGLPGRVLEAGKALWIEDVTIHGDFPRAEVSRDVGLKAGFGLPVMIEKDVVGVLEFFIPEVMPRDDGLLRVGTHIGTQLGRVVERHRIEEGLRSLDTARAEFVANAAHELRTPLTTIMGITEILTNPRTSRSEEQHAESLELLARQGKRIGALLTSLLDYSRIEVRGADLEFEDIDVAAAVHHATTAAPAPQGVTINNSVPPSVVIRADAVRLEQVLVNLLTNAYRYGGSTITIAAATEDDDVVLSVTDDGPGIEPHLQASLFDPFTRGSGSQSIIGSGLGLAIVKRLVESFGGEIGCENLATGGASFAIRLPTAN